MEVHCHYHEYQSALSVVFQISRISAFAIYGSHNVNVALAHARLCVRLTVVRVQWSDLFNLFE